MGHQPLIVYPQHRTVFETNITSFPDFLLLHQMVCPMRFPQAYQGLASPLQTVLLLGLLCLPNVRATSPTFDRLYDEIMETHQDQQCQVQSVRRRLPDFSRVMIISCGFTLLSAKKRCPRCEKLVAAYQDPDGTKWVINTQDGHSCLAKTGKMEVIPLPKKKRRNSSGPSKPSSATRTRRGSV